MHPVRLIIACLLLPTMLLTSACPKNPPNVAIDPAPEAANPGPAPLKSMNGTLPRNPANPSSYSFVVFGDNQNWKEAANGTEDQVLRSIFARMNNPPAGMAKPDFIFSVGDIIGGEPPTPIDTTKIKSSLTNYLNVLKAGGVPVFNAPGNHEMNVTPSVGGEMPDKQMHDLYTQTLGTGLYGAFTYGHSRFIVLNTSDIKDDGSPPNCKALYQDHTPPWNDKWECSYIGNQQLQWFKTELAASQNDGNIQHIFIGMHYPIHAKPSEDHPSFFNPFIADVLTREFKKAPKIAFVFSSHQHLFFNYHDPHYKAPDYAIAPWKPGMPPQYLVTGGAGAQIFGRGSPGNLNHYLTVQVSGSLVSVSLADDILQR